MGNHRSNLRMPGSPTRSSSSEWISVEIVAARAGITTRRVQYLERAGIVEPVSGPFSNPRYTEETIQRIIQVERLVNDLGVNLAGAEVILNMRQRMLAMIDEIDRLQGNL